MMNTKGFTLVELMVTVSVMSILASAAIPSTYNALLKKQFQDVTKYTLAVKRDAERCLNLYDSPKICADWDKLDSQAPYSTQNLDNVSLYAPEGSSVLTIAGTATSGPLKSHTYYIQAFKNGALWDWEVLDISSCLEVNYCRK